MKDKAFYATDAHKAQAFEWLRLQSLNKSDHESAFFAAVLMYEIVKLKKASR